MEMIMGFFDGWLLRFGELSSDAKITVCKNWSPILHYVQLFGTYAGQ